MLELLLLFGILWGSFLYHYSSESSPSIRLVSVITPAFETLCQFLYGASKPQSIPRESPRANDPYKRVMIERNNLEETHWRRGRTAILKHVEDIRIQGNQDGDRNRNAIVYGLWDASADLLPCTPRELSIHDAKLPWWTKDVGAPSISPDDAPKYYPCYGERYPVSDSGLSDSETCHFPKPDNVHADRLVDPTHAYFWFRFIHTAILDLSCADHKLKSRCTPLVLVAMVHLGWISLVDAISFTESRKMLGKGLVEASLYASHGQYGQFLDDMRSMGRPTCYDMGPFQNSWEKSRKQSRKQKDSSYNLKKDQLERIRNGPFGTAFVHYGSANDLEVILDKLLHSAPGSVMMGERLDAVLKPLNTRTLTHEELAAAKSRARSSPTRISPAPTTTPNPTMPTNPTPTSTPAPTTTTTTTMSSRDSINTSTVSTSMNTGAYTSTNSYSRSGASSNFDPSSWFVNSNVDHNGDVTMLDLSSYGKVYTVGDHDIMMTESPIPQEPEVLQCSRVRRKRTTSSFSSSPLELLREYNSRKDSLLCDPDSSLTPELDSGVVVQVQRYHPYRPALKKHIRKHHERAFGIGGGL